MKTRRLATVADRVSVGDSKVQAAGLVSRMMVSSDGDSSGYHVFSLVQLICRASS